MQILQAEKELEQRCDACMVLHRAARIGLEDAVLQFSFCLFILVFLIRFRSMFYSCSGNAGIRIRVLLEQCIIGKELQTSVGGVGTDVRGRERSADN